MKRLLTVIVLVGVVGCGGGEPAVSDATQKFLEANELLAKGEKEAALAALDESIAAGPTLWSYRARAKLHAQGGHDQQARADCEAGLKIVADDPDLLWIQGELAKPVAQRFQGKFSTPPSVNR